ncbi:hypothetical protein NBH00_06600 [Paraconexibacter antarcticus]|uniref:Uncharacterized protein n=1 Tax=Paraconexibacter antarcticus TaxID=2949664 RepID=A0ABY5DY80_9ACTN|nr:hypothetical protein [Paraconexibacter antarcticus]UTI65879.1 hypothetical protein NBH00_06600 [Paraconexibacter antarcticus]
MTTDDVVQACSGCLVQEDLEQMVSLDLEEALGYAFTALMEAGIEDPEAFLREKGILE